MCSATGAFAGVDNPRIRLETSKGVIVLELDRQAAPMTVENMLGYVKSGFYNGTIFHRVIKGFMIQGGGLTEDMESKATNKAIRNEADNGLKNTRGTVAMARTQYPHSATSQFFINTVNNTALDYRGKTVQGWGYCVFGKVIEGMDVVDAIENVPTTTKSMHQDVPSTPVIIKQATIVSISEKGKP
ncbi:MAG TPA: peptidylprolyl isomerase [Deltaproteobacteria bacterium]|nr:peptidylprolyl isomerase [Deltaproteobacteria bacterium]